MLSTRFIVKYEPCYGSIISKCKRQLAQDYIFLSMFMSSLDISVTCRYDMPFSHSPWVQMQLVEGLAESLGLKDRQGDPAAASDELVNS